VAPLSRKSLDNNNFKVNQRNISVPRQNHKSNINSSQDYTSYKEKPLSKIEKLNFNKTEALNNSTGNGNGIHDLGLTYGSGGGDMAAMSNEDDAYKQSALIMNNG